MRYRRNRATGASYFLTLVLADRQSTLLVRHIDLLRDALKSVRQRHPFVLDAIVVLPDHVHLLVTLPENDSDYPKRIMLIKQHFSRHIPRGEHISTSRAKKASVASGSAVIGSTPFATMKISPAAWITST